MLTFCDENTVGPIRRLDTCKFHYMLMEVDVFFDLSIASMAYEP